MAGIDYTQGVQTTFTLSIEGDPPHYEKMKRYAQCFYETAKSNCKCMVIGSNPDKSGVDNPKTSLCFSFNWVSVKNSEHICWSCSTSVEFFEDDSFFSIIGTPPFRPMFSVDILNPTFLFSFPLCPPGFPQSGWTPIDPDFRFTISQCSARPFEYKADKSEESVNSMDNLKRLRQEVGKEARAFNRQTKKIRPASQYTPRNKYKFENRGAGARFFIDDEAEEN